MKKLIAFAVIAALVAPAVAGDLIVEDFNSGPFTQGTTTRAFNEATVDDDGDANTPEVHDYYYYDWRAGGAATDDIGGWRALIDYGSLQPADTEVRLDGWLGVFGPSGANSMAGWTTADGNLSSFYAKQNDVPKSGWDKIVTVDSTTSGARDAANNQLFAFKLVYDAELAFVHPTRGAVGRVNVDVIVDGTNHEFDSPHFYRETIAPGDGNSYPIVWDGGFTPGPDDVNVESVATGTLLNTTDGSQDAAMTGLESDIIINPIADGNSIKLRFLNNRFSAKTKKSAPYINEAGKTKHKIGSNWQYMAMGVDNVKLVALEAGDTDGDFDVDFTDFNNLSNGFGSGTTWAEGDTDGDGDVDFTDFNNLANNFGAAYAPGVPGDLDADEVELVVDITTGEMKLVSGGAVELNGYSITSASGALVADADGSASPFMFYLSNTASEVAAGNVGSKVTVDGELALDAGFAGDQDLAFEYGTAAGTFAGDIQYVPEPATMSLLAIGGVAALIRRKK